MTLVALLAVAGFVAGLTGSWSPCGFSMVSTLGPTGHSGGRGTTLAACAAFVPGALAGGVLTFGSLALLGSLLGAGQVALLAGAGLAAAAALADATGRRIVPQIRRQVPEHWRRVLPLPLAAAAYGVLLGLGFTTFVLTFAVPALAGVSLAVGDPAAGLALGLAFGIGRALPVVVLAPLAEAPAGMRAVELMAERPAILRGFRAADAAALAAVALALGAQSASAQSVTTATTPFVAPASDPTIAGTDLAWKVDAGAGMIRTPAGDQLVEARQIAIGGPHVAVLLGEEVRINDRATGREIVRVPAPGVNKIAVSERWLVMRSAFGDLLTARRIPEGETRPIASGRPDSLGRPALDGDRVVYHYAGVTTSRIDEINLLTGEFTVLRRSTRTSLTNPSLLGEELAYVETSQWSQSVRLGPRPEGGRTLLRIAPAITADKGYTTKHGPHRRVRRPVRPPKEGPVGTTTTLWTTALAPDAVYVTRLQQQRGAQPLTSLLRLPR